MAERLTSRSKVKAAKKPKKDAKKKAARVAPQVISDAVGGNLPDGTIKSFFRESSALLKVAKSAQGEYRAHVKKGKELGLDPADISHEPCEGDKVMLDGNYDLISLARTINEAQREKP